MALPSWLFTGRPCTLPELQAILDAYDETLEDYIIDIDEPSEMEGRDIRSVAFLTPEEAFGYLYSSGLMAFAFIGYSEYIDFHTGEIVGYYVVVVDSNSGRA